MRCAARAAYQRRNRIEQKEKKEAIPGKHSSTFSDVQKGIKSCFHSRVFYQVFVRPKCDSVAFSSLFSKNSVPSFLFVRKFEDRVSRVLICSFRGWSERLGSQQPSQRTFRRKSSEESVTENAMRQHPLMLLRLVFDTAALHFRGSATVLKASRSNVPSSTSPRTFGTYDDRYNQTSGASDSHVVAD